MTHDEAPRPPNALGSAVFASDSQIINQAKLFAVIFIFVGLNITADDFGHAVLPSDVVKGVGISIVVVAVIMWLVFDWSVGRHVRKDNIPGSGPNPGRVRVFLGAIVLASLALLIAVGCTGGPLVSPYGQYFVGVLVIAQMLAPTVRAALAAFALTALGFVVAGAPWWFGELHDTSSSWTSWHYLFPVVVIAMASTWVNVSDIADDVRERKSEELGPSHGA
jgi:hypothetical protein